MNKPTTKQLESTVRKASNATQKQKASWLAGLLSGWGVRESWAKIIAGAVIGALCAAGVLTLDGCTATVSQSTDGGWQYHGVIILPTKK